MHPNSPEAMAAEKTQTPAVTSPPNGNGGRPAITAEVFAAKHASESTKIEAERAKAEVIGKIMAARSMPRNEAECRRKILEMCEERAWAAGDNIAFYDFRRGGQKVRDMTIHVATEMARIWGNMEYGVVELARGEGVSEMRAFAWDQQTNTSAVSNFIVPHSRDTKDGKRPLVDDRDIYENNANQGARRVREMIFRLVPRYIRDEARAALESTLAKGDGTPLPKRRRDLADAFLKHGVTGEMIEAYAGRAVAELTEHDIGDLRVTFQSIKNGEIRVEDVFGTGPKPTGALAVAAAEKAKAAAAAANRAPDAGEQMRALQDAADPLAKWRIPGSARALDGIVDLLPDAASEDDVKAIQAANAERIANCDKQAREAITKALTARAQELTGTA